MVYRNEYVEEKSAPRLLRMSYGVGSDNNNKPPLDSHFGRIVEERRLARQRDIENMKKMLLVRDTNTSGSSRNGSTRSAHCSMLADLR